MSEFNEMPYTADEIPVQKIFAVDGIDYTFQITFNKTKDFYVLSVLNDEAEILYTSKLVAGGDALHAASAILNLISAIKPLPRIDSDALVLNLNTFFTEMAIVIVTPD